jgi:cob(I)alamin adenosyltransferase
MVKLNKIYTRTGDAGQTGLADGSRVAKYDLRVVTYGDVDEANATIGIVRLYVENTGARRYFKTHPARFIRSRRGFIDAGEAG